MNGYSSHTFLWYNIGGEYSWVRYPLTTDQGMRNLTHNEATRLDGVDPNCSRHEATALGLEVGDIVRPANWSQEKRARATAQYTEYNSPEDGVRFHIVMPAKAGIQYHFWIPAKNMPE